MYIHSSVYFNKITHNVIIIFSSRALLGKVAHAFTNGSPRSAAVVPHIHIESGRSRDRDRITTDRVVLAAIQTEPAIRCNVFIFYFFFFYPLYGRISFNGARCKAAVRTAVGQVQVQRHRRRIPTGHGGGRTKLIRRGRVWRAYATRCFHKHSWTRTAAHSPVGIIANPHGLTSLRTVSSDNPWSDDNCCTNVLHASKDDIVLKLGFENQ